MMETVNDYGVVSYFSVQTLTTGIFSTWLERGNAGGAAQLSSLVLVVILTLMAVERIGRNRLRFHAAGRHRRPVTAPLLRGPAAWLSAGACFEPLAG